MSEFKYKQLKVTKRQRSVINKLAKKEGCAYLEAKDKYFDKLEKRRQEKMKKEEGLNAVDTKKPEQAAAEVKEPGKITTDAVEEKPMPKMSQQELDDMRRARIEAKKARGLPVEEPEVLEYLKDKCKELEYVFDESNHMVKASLVTPTAAHNVVKDVTELMLQSKDEIDKLLAGIDNELRELDSKEIEKNIEAAAKGVSVGAEPGSLSAETRELAKELESMQKPNVMDGALPNIEAAGAAPEEGIQLRDITITTQDIIPPSVKLAQETEAHIQDLATIMERLNNMKDLPSSNWPHPVDMLREFVEKRLNELGAPKAG
jgi:hypothetical protein